jgi:hypothetical protein
MHFVGFNQFLHIRNLKNWEDSTIKILIADKPFKLPKLGPKLPQCWHFRSLVHTDTSHSVGHLCTRDRPVAVTCTIYNTVYVIQFDS